MKTSTRELLIRELFEEREQMDKVLQSFEAILDQLEHAAAIIPEETLMRLRTQLSAEKRGLVDKINIDQKLIILIQKSCDHEYQPDGEDSHKAYEKCIICRHRRVL